MSQTDNHSESTENVAKKGIKRMDAVVTGVILGGLIASIYGVSKLREKEKDEHSHLIELPKFIERKPWWKRIFGKK